MKYSHISRIGGIFFFIGLFLILLSWHLTYPVYMPELNELTLTQFYPSIWLGMILSLIGLFLMGYYSKRKSIKLVCISFFPIILYANVYFFSYIPSSDSGAVKAMFEVFHYTGINPGVESYFQYPVYFTINEMTSQMVGLTANSLAVLFFALFGILIALYLYLFLLKLTKNNSYQIAFLAVLIYFTAAYNFLNYQWAPQTIALVFLLILFILFDKKRFEYTLLSVVIFISLVFTHLFIPIIFILFLGFYSITKKELINSFLLMACIYFSVLIYYTTFYLPIIIETFKQSIYGFGEEYSIKISRSFMEPKGIISQIISMINRIRVPLTWIVVSMGFFIGFIKKKLSLPAIALGLTGGFYLTVGLFYTVLGMRALQILFIPLVIGIGFFITKWKKPTLILVFIFLILSIFGPMRSVYDTYQFQLNEEENACNFLATFTPKQQEKQLVIGDTIDGYFKIKHTYLNFEKRDYTDPSIFRYNNTWWMFVSNTKSNICRLYYSDNLTDPFSFTEHPFSPIATGKDKARPGGRTIVFDNDRIIRFAQKCDIVYGEMVRAFEVDTLTKTSYAEHEIFESPILEGGGSRWNSSCMHHFDPWWTGDHWLCVADAKSGDEWSIGVYTAKNNWMNITQVPYGEIIPDWKNIAYDPFNLSVPAGITNPVITSSDVTDVPASYVADPFMFYEDGMWYMFFEVYISGHGDIGLATSNDGLHWTYEKIVLSEEWHLSYPMVLKYNNKYYMIPESYVKNEVRLYKAIDFPYNWTFVTSLLGRFDSLYLIEPNDLKFYRIFNTTIEKNDYILYNPKLGKDLISYGYKLEEIDNFKERILLNNKIYECGKTFIVIGG